MLTTAVFEAEDGQNVLFSLVQGWFHWIFAILVSETQNWFWLFPGTELETFPIDYLLGAYTASFNSIGVRPSCIQLLQEKTYRC